ncbi:MAG: hypothetical protein KDA24_04505 [Deltaproteobacteria bacterium]|nr:hypothetical protein [Deltaproteobacteria bacterium]
MPPQGGLAVLAGEHLLQVRGMNGLRGGAVRFSGSGVVAIGASALVAGPVATLDGAEKVLLARQISGLQQLPDSTPVHLHGRDGLVPLGELVAEIGR